MLDRDLEPDDGFQGALCPKCYSQEAVVIWPRGIICAECEETFHPWEPDWDSLDLERQEEGRGHATGVN